MRARHHPIPDRATAERLLGGAAAGPAHGREREREHGLPQGRRQSWQHDPQHRLDRLVDLLATARGPAVAGELAGEQDAMDAFRAARQGAIVRPRPPSLLRSVLANVLTLKALIVAAVAVAVTGGMALAANNSALPGPLGGDRPRTSPTQPRATAHPSGTPSVRLTSPPSPSLVGLCRAYTSGVDNNPGKALDNPAFGALIDAAGGREKVASYCDAVLAAADKHPKESHSPRGRPNATPEHPGRGSDRLPNHPLTSPPPDGTPPLNQTSDRPEQAQR